MIFGKIRRMAKRYEIEVVLIDIDGTIKDLAREHNMALDMALMAVCPNRKLRIKLCNSINNIGIWFMKSGILPTNANMQKTFLTGLSIIVGVKRKTLIDKYFELYPKKAIMFEPMKDVMKELSAFKVIFVTNNTQTIEMKTNGYEMECVDEAKEKIYADLFREHKLVPEKTMIVGDNIFDDYIPARKLGAAAYLVNRYDSWFKARIIEKLKKKK